MPGRKFFHLREALLTKPDTATWGEHFREWTKRYGVYPYFAHSCPYIVSFTLDDLNYIFS